MREIAIYLEGGGSGAGSVHQKAALRNGMSALLGPLKKAAQDKGIGWKLTPCGGRNDTFGKFKQALQQADEDTVVVLLVDSEDEIPSEAQDVHANARARCRHLAQRDKWDLTEVDPHHVHLMVRCMETWIVADREGLAAYYGQGFQVNSLPNRQDLEEEPKEDVHSKLKKATRNTQKGEYEKIRHASDLLQRISPEKVARRCRRFKTFTAWLNREIAEA